MPMLNADTTTSDSNDTTLRQRKKASKLDDDDTNTVPTSDDDSDSNSQSSPSQQQQSTTVKPRKSLQDRKKIPPSLYLTVLTVIFFQVLSGVWSVQTLEQWWSSMSVGGSVLARNLCYLLEGPPSADDTDNKYQYVTSCVLAALSAGVVYMFVIAPLRAGMWTGSRARRHVFHRYAGLLYMTQYAAAWLEFSGQYNPTSNLTHFIACNGLAQGISAFISFKVLPDLDDAGYISDKAVVSRNFVHENIFFTLMCFFGSIYYNADYRAQLQSTLPGRILECIFCFGPYVVVRTWFPITRFRNAGKTHKGRTALNLKFYEISTLLIKIFFLWAKYFLGFYINFLVFLDKITADQWRFVHGLYLLNLGTVSLAMFLHTLRFKKVLPPRLTMSIYLLQIYATFTAIPLAYPLFAQHWKLCALTAAGLLCNMTRNRKIHAAWCTVVMVLLVGQRDFYDNSGAFIANNNAVISWIGKIDW